MNRRNINADNYDNIYNEYTNSKLTVKEIADRYEISHMTVYRIVKKYKDGVLDIPQIDEHKRSKLKASKHVRNSSRRAKKDIDVMIVPATSELSDVDKQTWDRIINKNTSNKINVDRIYKDNSTVKYESSKKPSKHKSTKTSNGRRVMANSAIEEMIGVLDGYNE
jgi:transposase